MIGCWSLRILRLRRHTIRAAKFYLDRRRFPAYCCLLLPRGIRKSFGKNEKAGRGGGDRIYQGAESKGTLRNVL